MKRISKILCLAMIICMMATSVCFADTLKLENSYPADGSTGASIENLGVKLEFNRNMSASKAGKLNDENKIFALMDSEGKKLPIRVLYPPKEAGTILVLFDPNKSRDIQAQGNSEYTLTISNELVDDAGDVLDKDYKITFKTLNQNANTMINMVLMFVMFGGMMLFSTKSAKKTAEEAQQRMREEKVNPYKESKRTGKSVEEIIEQTEKDKAKRAAKEAKKAAKEADEYDWIDINTYRVNKRQILNPETSKYAAKKKAEIEAKKAAEKAAKEAKKAKRNVKKGKGKKK